MSTTKITSVSFNRRTNAGLLPYSEDIYDLAVTFATLEERDEFVSRFPKSMNVKATTLGCYNYEGNKGTTHIPYAFLSISWTTNRNGKENQVTGSRNESGIKRMKRFYDAIATQLESQSK